MTEGQALAPYLASRKGGWLNIVGAKWAGEEEIHKHAVIQVDQILAASSTDDAIPVRRPAPGAPRAVDIYLDDGTRMVGTLHLGGLQRLSDYLSVCGRFLPVLGCERLPGGEKLGDIALNALCVKSIRGAPSNPPHAALDPGGPRPTGSFQQLPEDE
ncbi:MAG TPA: hypothetical protein VHE78_04150 [Gemmatimonadaceae bacterium]|nr:hypothetical protein [Gemmatimonadaceae bacterium]